MTWYYALGNERQGPIDDAALDRLIASGVVTPDTLVWKAGMADWQPLGQARPRVAPVPAPVVPPPPAAIVPAPTDPSTQPRFGTPMPTPTPTPDAGAWAGSAGAAGSAAGNASSWSSPGAGPDEDADDIYARVTRSGPRIDVGDCVSRGWQAVSSNPGLAIGGPFLVLVVTTIAGMIPCVGLLTGIFLNPPLLAGLQKVFAKLDRGEPAEFGDLFAGFEGVYLNLILQNIVVSILALLAALPGGVVVFIGMAISERAEALGVLVAVVGGLIAAAPIIFLSLCWMFSVLLIVDRGIDFWPAMELSRKVVQQVFAHALLLALACIVVVIVGALALCLGLFVAIPIALGAVAAAYNALFGFGVRRTA
jgi:hypothetical protein